MTRIERIYADEIDLLQLYLRLFNYYPCESASSASSAFHPVFQ